MNRNESHEPFVNSRVCEYANMRVFVSYVRMVKRNVSGWCLDINKIQAHKCTLAHVQRFQCQAYGVCGGDTHTRHIPSLLHFWADRILR